MNLDELHNLIVRCLDGVADDHEYRTLAAEMGSNPDARARYVRECELRQALVEDFDQKTASRPPGAGSGWRVAAPLAWALALAASIAVVWLAVRPAPEVRPVVAEVQDAPNGAAAADVAIAQVVQKIDCVWSDEVWSLENSSKIMPGQTIALERGFMRLAFRNGVTAILEGPVQFTAVDELRGLLEYGGLGVRVPEGFTGYVVDTPSAHVIDLGTEFAVRVTENGATALRVVEGEVEVSPRDRRGNANLNKRALLKKDAVWNSASGLKPLKGAPSRDDFPTAMLLEDPVFDRIPELPVEGEPLLRLTADTAVQTDAEGDVFAWGDVSTMEARSRHSAWQVEPQRRPKLIQDGIGGAPSIRFDGVDDCLITEPFDNGDAQTIAVACRFNSLERPKGDIGARQIINYNGPPHLVVDYRTWAGVLRAQAYAGVGAQPEQTGTIRWRGVQKGETLLIVYTYDYAANEAVLFINGEERGRSKVAFGAAGNRPKVIGIHRRLVDGALEGDIAELILFDRALDLEEVRSLNGYLRERYVPSAVSRHASHALEDAELPPNTD